ncbi:hypothetical protein [Shivajiella indica]|uniref:DUF3955 domain-containing protein n=1 Tax=Shivajiella indica TaxID=872115 RepID=A0ABW5B779_9BACT
MKSNIWKFLVLTVLCLTIGAYAFIFKENQIGPDLWNIPFIFWSSFTVSVFVVIATFLGSKFFPYKESEKK